MTDSWNCPTRRQLIQFGGAGYLGLNLGGLWNAQAAPVPRAAPTKPIRACILVFYYGGPSHLDTYDLKPSAPAEVRGEFRAGDQRVTMAGRSLEVSLGNGDGGENFQRNGGLGIYLSEVACGLFHTGAVFARGAHG